MLNFRDDIAVAGVTAWPETASYFPRVQNAFFRKRQSNFPKTFLLVQIRCVEPRDVTAPRARNAAAGRKISRIIVAGNGT
jgi:hypothetical protein